MHNKKGMTLVETMVAIAIFSIISTALISMAVTTLSAQQSAKLKNLATRCAEAKMEEIKAWEASHRPGIQIGNWAGFTNTGNCPLIPLSTLSVSPPGSPVTVTVTWPYKGVNQTIRLVTNITVWQ